MTFVSYTRDYEDYRLYQALKDVDQGRCIDFSSPDDGYGSVSQAFYERGWSGLCRYSTSFPRQRDRYVTGSLVDLVNQASEWINSEDVQFLAVDADMPAESLQRILAQTACRPCLILVRRVLVFMHHAQLDEVLKEASYSQRWSDGVNVFWVAHNANVNLATCFEPLTHCHPVISLELLELRVDARAHKTLVHQLAKVSQKLVQREREINELNLGLASARQAYENAVGAYHKSLAWLPVGIAKKLTLLPKNLLLSLRRVAVKSVRWTALKLLAFLERRPSLLSKLMKIIKKNQFIEKLARKITGKHKAEKVEPHHLETICAAMSPDETKIYQQIKIPD